jgi:hypothetical protein
VGEMMDEKMDEMDEMGEMDEIDGIEERKYISVDWHCII